MKSKNAIVIGSLYVIAAALGLVIGFGVSRQMRRVPGEQVVRSEMAPHQDPTDRRVPSANANPETRSDPSFVAGWVYRVPVEEIPRWVKHFAESGNRTVLETLFVRWTKADPEAALAAALALPSMKAASVSKFEDGVWLRSSGHSRSWMLVNIMRTWMRADPDAGMAALLALPDEAADRRELLSYTLRSYAPSRPADAVRVAFEELRPHGRFEVGGGWSDLDGGLVGPLFHYWGASDPHAALAGAKGIAERKLRATAMESAFEVWSASAPGAARRWFDALAPADQTKELRGAMLAALAKTDPQRAMVLSYENAPDDDGGRGMMTWYWANKDVEGMLRAVGEVDVPAVQAQMVKRGLETMANTHTGEEMAAMAMSLPSDVQQNALQELARHWSKQDAAAAERWGLELEDPILRRQFLREFYSHQMGSAPAEVAASVSHIPDVGLRGMVAADVALHWSRENPALAAEWIASSAGVIAPDVLKQTHQFIARHWTRRSPDDALGWFSTLEDEAMRQAASQEIAYGLQELTVENGTDGAALIKAADSLSEDDRTLLLERLSPAKVPSGNVDPFAGY